MHEVIEDSNVTTTANSFLVAGSFEGLENKKVAYENCANVTSGTWDWNQTHDSLMYWTAPGGLAYANETPPRFLNYVTIKYPRFDGLGWS